MNDDYGSTFVALIEQIEAAKDAATTWEALLAVWHDVQAVGNLTRSHKLSFPTIFRVAKVRLETERKLGLFLRGSLHPYESNKYETGELKRYPGVTRHISLGELNISKKNSSRAQRIASIPDDAFNAFCNGAFRDGLLPTIKEVEDLGRAYSPPKSHKALCADDRKPPVSWLTPLIKERQKFATIFAAPDWPSERVRPAESQPFMERLAVEPVAAVAARDCALHVLAPTRWLHCALDLLRAWKFQFVSLRINFEERERESKYWQSAQTFLVLGVRGEPTFASHTNSGLEKVDSSRIFFHEKIVQLIEEVSVGPYLELFRNRCCGRDEWTCCNGL